MGLFGNSTHPIWLILFALGLSLVPILVGISTSYLKVSIVLGMFRSGLGAQQVPGNMVIMAISLVVTLFVMGPVMNDCVKNLADKDIRLDKLPTAEELSILKNAFNPWREFLSLHAGKEELKTLYLIRSSTILGASTQNTDNTSPSPPEATAENQNHPSPDLTILLTSFLLTELKEAFSMGFVLLLPFLIIDLIVSNILVGMGMFMVSPAMITLPLKLMLFIACDGWLLLTKGLVMSYV